MKKTIFITGASGFIGKKLVCQLSENDLYNIRIAGRNSLYKPVNENINYHVVKNFYKYKEWKNILTGCDTIIHLASMVHFRGNQKLKSHQYNLVNTKITKRIADFASKSNVKRFIFISSAKVNGEHTEKNKSIDINMTPYPKDIYAISKYNAEKELIKISQSSKLEFVIIRPPLVYGPGVKANFLSLITLVKTRLPLPF